MANILGVVIGYAVGVFTGNWWLFASSIYGDQQARKADRERRRSIERYNASLADRLEMLDLQPNAPRSLVLGRVRYVEGVRRRWTSGTNEEKLTMIVSFAGHEIDAFESWYLDDKPVTLDGDGWVNEEPYRKVQREQRTALGTLNGSGAATITIESGYVSGTASALWYTGTGDGLTQGTASVSVSGTTATVTGGQAGAELNVNYSVDVSTKYVRIRPYLGTAAQNVGAAIASEYPGKITSTDKFAGIALAVVDVLYEPDVFPQGRPTVTAVMRGAKCLDPRTGSTVWTENPALHAYHYARWSAGWDLDATHIRTQDVEDAADACDVSTVFTLTATGGGTTTVTLPRYRCGITISADSDHAEAMEAILETMNGRAGWAGGIWRLRAGKLASTAFTVDDAWLVADTTAGGVSDDPVITAVQSIPRDLRFNRVTGSCIDPAQRYQLLPFPAIEDSVLVAAKGERPTDVEYPGVTHIAHAQHLASMAIRSAQAGLRVQMTCGEQAADVELFDVGAVTLSEYGYSGKLFEVIGWGWSQTKAYRLQLAEITADLFTVEALLQGRDPAPDSDMRKPYEVEDMGAITVTSGTVALTDSGSVIMRTLISWPAAVGENIRRGGRVEVQYTQATGALPPGDWPVWEEGGDATSTVIPGLQAGRYYLFRARFVQTLPRVRGKWSAVVSHLVAAKRAAKIYRQTSAPSAGLQDGDEWYDTDDGNHHYVRVSGSWVSVRDTTIATALATAEAAQATADGKIDTFWQTTAPSSASEGDLWFDTDDGLKQYRRTSGAWVLAADTRIGQAISDAADAQATADGKVRTFVQTSSPTAEAVGDLWFDTDDGYKLYRWSGSAWVNVRDTGIALALTNAAAAQATADGKIDTFWQATPPSSSAEGDIWFDTDDGYKQYRRTSGAWVLAADTRIGQAISDAADAQATADGKVRTFVQAAAPMAESIGDLWFDTDDGYKPHRWNGSSWISVQDTSIAAALAAANDAQATADGKIATFYQTTAPSSGVSSVGDLWFDTDDGFKQYRYSGSAWVIAADTRIGQAITDAADAQATADGKVVTFVQTSAPTAEAVGDLWLDSDDGNKLYRWSGSAWVALPVGTGAIAPTAATDVVADTSSSLSHSFVSSTPGFAYLVQRLLPISWTNTLGYTVTVELSAQIRGLKSSGPGQVWLDAASSSVALTSNVFSSLISTDLHTEVTAGVGTYTHTDSLSVSPGGSIHFALTVYIYSAVGTTTNFSGDGRLRIVAIKR